MAGVWRGEDRGFGGQRYFVGDLGANQKQTHDVLLTLKADPRIFSSVFF